MPRSSEKRTHPCLGIRRRRAGLRGHCNAALPPGRPNRILPSQRRTEAKEQHAGHVRVANYPPARGRNREALCSPTGARVGVGGSARPPGGALDLGGHSPGLEPGRRSTWPGFRGSRPGCSGPHGQPRASEAQSVTSKLRLKFEEMRRERGAGYAPLCPGHSCLISQRKRAVTSHQGWRTALKTFLRGAMAGAS